MRLSSFRLSSFVLCTSLVLPIATSIQKALAADAAASETKPASDADKAWQEILQSAQPVTPPEAWQKVRPSQQEIENFKASEAERLAKAAAAAKDFQARFPNSSNAAEARDKEFELLQIAAQLGSTNGIARIEALEKAKLADPNTSEDDRFQTRMGAINRAAMSKMADSRAAAFAEVEKGARALLKEFPKRTEPYDMLMAVAGEAEPEKARQLAKELSESNASDQVKEAAKLILAKADRVGKPVPIKFAAVDGRQVDLEKLRGKVVLIDFWATWCGPCVQEIPNVLKAYETLHPKGFEIVGISFDSDKSKLTSFVEQRKMTWPQYFDGKQWANEYGKLFGIESIPTMWLVDKKGNLRDLNGRADLVSKVEKLLAEKP